MDKRAFQPQGNGRVIVDLNTKKVRSNPPEKTPALPRTSPKYYEGTNDDILQLLKTDEILENEGIFLKNKVPPQNGILEVEFIKNGGFSKSIRVYKDPRDTSKSYVCKEVKSEKFNKNEVIHMCQLDDIYICKLYGLVRKTNEYHIFMEYCGLNLKVWTELFTFSHDHVVDISKQLCMAVEFAHNKMILHLDIKPENVCLLFTTERIALKLTDWGSSTKTYSSTEAQSFTLIYAPPELLYRYICQMLNSHTMNEESTSAAVKLTQKFSRNYNHIDNVSTSADSYSIGLTIMFTKTKKHLYGTVSMKDLFKMFAEDPNVACNLFPDDNRDFITDISKMLVKGDSHIRPSVKDVQKWINDYLESLRNNTKETQCTDATPDQEDDQEFNVPDLAELFPS